jgi:hypothetical protein
MEIIRKAGKHTAYMVIFTRMKILIGKSANIPVLKHVTAKLAM